MWNGDPRDTILVEQVTGSLHPQASLWWLWLANRTSALSVDIPHTDYLGVNEDLCTWFVGGSVMQLMQTYVIFHRRWSIFDELSI